MEFEEIRLIVREVVVQILVEQMDLEEAVADEIILDEDSLIEGGFIDSMSFIQLVELCQMKFGVFINTSEISIEDWNSIARISNFIESIFKKENIVC